MPSSRLRLVAVVVAVVIYTCLATVKNTIYFPFCRTLIVCSANYSTPGAADSPGRVSVSPAPAPSEGSGRKTALVAVGVGLAVGFLGIVVLGVGGAVWWKLRQPEAPGVEAPAAATGETVAVALEVEDPKLQWLKLSDAAGARVAKAKPSGSAQIEPGTYALSAKIVGRPAISGEVEVTGDATWRCVVADDAKVRCEEDTSGVTLTLAPEPQ